MEGEQQRLFTEQYVVTPEKIEKKMGEVAVKIVLPDFDRDTFLDGLGGQPPDWYWNGQDTSI